MKKRSTNNKNKPKKPSEPKFQDSHFNNIGKKSNTKTKSMLTWSKISSNSSNKNSPFSKTPSEEFPKSYTNFPIPMKHSAIMETNQLSFLLPKTITNKVKTNRKTCPFLKAKIKMRLLKSKIVFLRIPFTVRSLNSKA